MALSYTEIHDLRNHPDIIKKIHVAIADVAVSILAPEANTTVDRTTWAKEAIKNPGSKAPEIVHYVLIANSGAENPQVAINAADAAIKAAVSVAVNKIVGVTGA